MISFIKGKKLCEKVIATLLFNHGLAVINCIFFWKTVFNFTSSIQAWLLPDLYNQEIP